MSSNENDTVVENKKDSHEESMNNYHYSAQIWTEQASFIKNKEQTSPVESLPTLSIEKKPGGSNIDNKGADNLLSNQKDSAPSRQNSDFDRLLARIVPKGGKVNEFDRVLQTEDIRIAAKEISKMIVAGRGFGDASQKQIITNVMTAALQEQRGTANADFLVACISNDLAKQGNGRLGLISTHESTYFTVPNGSERPKDSPKWPSSGGDRFERRTMDLYITGMPDSDSRRLRVEVSVPQVVIFKKVAH